MNIVQLPTGATSHSARNAGVFRYVSGNVWTTIPSVERTITLAVPTAVMATYSGSSGGSVDTVMGARMMLNGQELPQTRSVVGSQWRGLSGVYMGTLAAGRGRA